MFFKLWHKKIQYLDLKHELNARLEFYTFFTELIQDFFTWLIYTILLLDRMSLKKCLL